MWAAVAPLLAGVLAASAATPGSWSHAIEKYQDCSGFGVPQRGSEPGPRFILRSDLEGRSFDFPLRRESAFEVLLNTCEFRDHEFGYASVPSLQVYAFNVLLDEPDAAALFRDLSVRANTPGKLYALCALILVQSEDALPLETELRSSEPAVANDHCVVGLWPVAEILGSIRRHDLPGEFRRAYPRAREVHELDSHETPNGRTGGKNVTARPIIVEQTYEASLASVWKAITDGRQMRQWFFGSIANFEPRVGFETRFDVEADGRTFPHLVKVTEVVPQRKIVYDWRYGGYPGDSSVSWELSETRDGTTLKLTHRGIETFPQDDPIFSRESGEAGWGHFLHRSLKAFLEGE